MERGCVPRRAGSAAAVWRDGVVKSLPRLLVGMLLRLPPGTTDSAGGLRRAKPFQLFNHENSKGVTVQNQYSQAAMASE